MADDVQNKPLKDVVNEVIAEASWGIVTHKSNIQAYESNPSSFISLNDNIWQPVKPFKITPFHEQQSNNTNIINFVDWVKQELPHVPNETASDIAMLKAKRKGITSNFIQLLDKANADYDIYRNSLQSLLSKMSTKASIVPAFFNMVNNFIHERRSFCIIFRTFGTDIKDVQQEFNEFCVANGYDGSRIREGIADYCLYNKNIGILIRDKYETHLVMNCLERNPIESEMGNISFTEFETIDRMKYYQNIGNNVQIISGDRNIYSFIVKQSSISSMAMSDDYIWWSMHERNAECGKILVLPSLMSVGKSPVVHQIFFDDNIQFDNSAIVDVRRLDEENINSSVSVGDKEWSMLCRTHLHKTEPLLVMMNDKYFVQQIEEYENNFSNKYLATGRSL